MSDPENLRFKKYGQVFLRDKNIARFESSLFDIREGTRVMEIGPGDGILTEFLLQVGFSVTCVETDHRYVLQLQNRFSDHIEKGRLAILKGDFLSIPSMEVDAIFGNIPYHISSPIVFTLPRFRYRKCILMVQQEFAERMIALPGSPGYSRLSVNTWLRYLPKIEKKVSRRCFSPVPEVDSAIITLSPTFQHNEEDIARADPVIRKLFSQRRKKIGTLYRDAPQEIREKRVEELSPEDIFSFALSTG